MHQHETYLHYFLYHNGQIKFFNELINPECDCMSLCLKEENKRILANLPVCCSIPHCGGTTFLSKSVSL